jgi:signal transduction histidine kinase
VRVYVLLAMMTVVVVSVGLTGVLTYKDVEAELRHGDPQLSAKLLGCIMRAVVEAGLISSALALVLAVPISLQVARPLRRLDDLADRIVATGATVPRVALGGGREIGELGATLERLAASLRRQDEVRRATAADATHELRGGLGSMICRVEAAQDGIIDAETGLRDIALDARRMGRVLDDLHLLVEAQRPAVLVSNEHVDLAAVVSGRVSAYASRFEAASIQLEQSIAPARVDGDPERLAQVVDNLLANALRYTDGGGRVTVAVTRGDDEAVIAVTDNGVGITEAHISHVVDRFWRAPGSDERAAEGSGVGLAVVRDLVVAHHGRVEVESRLGRGSRFSVHLPAEPHASGGASPHPPAPAASSLRTPLQRDLTHGRALV